MIEIDIFELLEFDSAVVAPVRELIVQLTGNPETSFQDADLKEIINSANSHLFLLRYNGVIAGMLTVGIYKTPSGIKSWIEDVVIEQTYRKKGLSKQLLAHVVKFLQDQGIPVVMLTSNPLRIAANSLYPSMGFEKRETNVYRMAPGKGNV